MLNPLAAFAAAPPSASRRLPGSPRGGGWMHLALVGVSSMLLVYIAASIVLTVPLAELLTLLGLAGALLLWAVAVVAWWRNTDALRSVYAPGGDVTRTDLVVTLLLAAAPGLLAMFDIALVFIP